MKRSQSFALMSAMFLALIATDALAQSSATMTIPIQATIGATASQPVLETSGIDGCTVASNGVNFGAVNGSALRSVASSAGYTVQGSLTVTCGPSAAQLGSFSIQIGLDDGANEARVAALHLPTGSTATRALSHGRSLIAYDLFKPVVGAGLFFNGIATTATISPARSEWGNIARASDASACEVPGSSPLGSAYCLVNEGGNGLAFTLPFTVLAVVPVSGSGTITIPIVATIPGGQVQPLPPGVYTDTVTVTLLFF